MKHLLLAAITLALSCQALAQDPSAENPPEGTPHAFDAGWQGEKTCEVLEENEHYRVARCVFPPGIGHEKHYHNPHFGYVLEGGTFEVRDSEGQRSLTTVTGGTWTTQVRTVHEGINTGPNSTSYLIIEAR